MMTQRNRRFGIQEAVIGSLMIVFGFVLLFQQMDVFYLEDFGIRSIWHLWPFIIVFIGIGKLVDAQSLFHMGKGFWMIFLGTWLYVSIYHVYGLTFHDTWPAILIAWGISLLWEPITKETKFYEEIKNGKQ